ncbi:RRM domain-containing protein [Caenorhabditis elegans]|uniref:RRM domain-containing protein n=4 Tax=Caenorhabditis elegans TaxID=6239 RepID=A8DYS0_CAEEL|nr:RRM domain-containing protein [Caenorhabditis elegans]CCD71502.1 RRM domain-containing protein [Caenorhabditis elegans]|eukprot:NP_001122631.1 ELAV-Type RNA binding-protein family [Caenorhabditis elegans]
MSGAVLPAVLVVPKMESVVVPIAESTVINAKDTTPSTAADNDVSPSPSEPDTDAIKMFVGQIPRQWNETDCRRLFEKYGSVFSCNILRDKSTQASKGCCFVTFYHRKDAIEAQGALHNIKVIEGMHHPVQMKPADTENRNERKLFIGQLSKKHNEENLREIFAKFGHIEDCSVLRDQDGKSRGCAFVTFTNRSCAVVATKEMHHSQTMEGCSAPLVVKFADTQKDKDVKTKSMITGSGAGSPKGGAASLLQNLNPALLQQLGGGQNYQAVASLLSLINGQQGQQQQHQQQQNVLGILGTGNPLLGNPAMAAQNQFDAITMAQIAHQQQMLALQGFAVQQGAPSQQQQGLFLAHQYSTNYSTGSPDSASNATDSSSDDNNVMNNRLTPTSKMAQYGYGPLIPRHPAQLYLQQRFPATAAAYVPGLAGGMAGAKTTSPVAASLANHQQIALTPFAGGAAALDHFQAMQQYALLANLQATGGVGVQATTSAAQMVGNGDVKGPDGANLFIYHLPQDFGDSDLINTFAPFGGILSAKVFIDKVTNLSKCFGFVSYENAQSATNAISAMNGFQIGSKRLKVQLKVDRGNPYNR